MLLLTRAMFAIPLLVAALVALLSPKGVAAHVVPRMSGLHSRQIEIPDNCVDICEELVTTLDACTTAACVCTAQNMDEAVGCIDCLGSEVSDGQEVIDELAQACDEYGITLSVPTVTPSAIPSGESIATTFTGTVLPTGSTM